MPENPPEMRSLPSFMLEAGDWVWHSTHRWFYRCHTNAMPPGPFTPPIAVNPDGEYSVALERADAEAWNKARRDERMS